MTTHHRRDVAVTGMGVVSPVGVGVSSFMEALLAGRRGIAPVRAIAVDDCNCRHGAEVEASALRDALKARSWNPSDRVIDMALLAAAEALEAAGLDERQRAQTGALIGTSFGPAGSIENSFIRFAELGRRGVRPTTIPRAMINAVSSQISMKFGLRGPNYVVVSACSSSTNAIGLAFRMVRDGYADRVLCGGSDSYFIPGMYVAWDKLGVMSKRSACRPFDADRDGFVLGEGAGMLLLEARGAAESRGASIRGWVAGFGESSDAVHLTRPSEEGQCDAIRRALADAEVGPDNLAFVNAHGTATQWNDECEARSIRATLGEAADRVPVVSQKSYFGHTMAGAGALETIVTLCALEGGLLPPNINLDNPDPSCQLCLPTGAPVRVSAPCALKNSFAFGGSNACLVLRGFGDAGST